MTAPTEPTYLCCTLRLRSPVIASTLAAGPNIAATQAFIPGSAIRGALAARLLANGSTGDSVEFRTLILSGAVRYLHAYPEIGGARGLPAPASWKSEKEYPDRAYDLAGFSGQITEQVDAEDFDKFWPEESLVSVGAPFTAATASAGARAIATPRTNARLHQQRDRVKGRPWLDKSNGQETPQGAIFAYEYLEAEQVFRGSIQVSSSAKEQIERIKALLSQPILIGRSRRAGYGGDAELAFSADATREYESVSGDISRALKAGEDFRVMLASAYIGRHPSTGQIDPMAIDHELGERLGAAVERRQWSFETIGSFNQKWRLEVAQVPAVVAGAVLVLKAIRAISLDNLREVEHQGFGERRVEGFGRVLFLEHSEDRQRIQLNRNDERRVVQQRARASNTQESGSNQLEFLEERIVLAAARAELDRLAADLAKDAKKPPTNSLLGRLRTVFRSVHDEATARNALGTLATWCNSTGRDALKDSARNKLETCRLPQSQLLQWLTGLSSNDSRSDQWKRLVAAVNDASTLTGLAQGHHLMASSSAERILQEHAALLSIQLIDAVLAALARRNREGSQ